MSKEHTRLVRAAAGGVGAAGGFLALALAAGCERDDGDVGAGGEPPPEMQGEVQAGEEPGGDDPTGAPAPGDGPAAGAQPPQGGGAPGGAPPQGGQAPGGAPPQGQAPEGHPQLGGQIDMDEEVTDEEVDEFAEAYLEVEDVQLEFEQELQAAESNQEAQAIRERAIAQIQEAVEDTGMEIETYGMMAQRLHQDPELIEEVQAVIESKRE